MVNKHITRNLSLGIQQCVEALYTSEINTITNKGLTHRKLEKQKRKIIKKSWSKFLV